MKQNTVLVTGASSGIGEATATLLARSGKRVFGTVRRAEDGERLAAGGVLPLVMDVTARESIARSRDAVREALGPDDSFAIVNNAGIAAVGPWELVPVEDVREVFEINLFGVINVLQEFLPLVRESAGRVVMISSVSGRIAAPFVGPYSSSKFALESLTDSLRREMRPFGVKVVAIEPGPIKTPIWRKARARAESNFPEGVYERQLRRFRVETSRAESRAIAPERVAKAVERVLSQRRPPARKIVTRRAWLVHLISSMPAGVVDRLASARMDRR